MSSRADDGIARLLEHGVGNGVPRRGKRRGMLEGKELTHC